eukprot:1857730-Amphidinium_carterae.1
MAPAWNPADAQKFMEGLKALGLLQGGKLAIWGRKAKKEQKTTSDKGSERKKGSGRSSAGP